jgi:hypothetical protein
LPPAVLVSWYPDLGYVPMSEGVQFNLFTVSVCTNPAPRLCCNPRARDWMRRASADHERAVWRMLGQPNYTDVFMGDECLMEGISQKAISLAGHLKLSRLIAFWDNNSISIDGDTSLAVSDNEVERFRASGWHVLEIDVTTRTRSVRRLSLPARLPTRFRPCKDHDGLLERALIVTTVLALRVGGRAVLATGLTADTGAEIAGGRGIRPLHRHLAVI